MVLDSLLSLSFAMTERFFLTLPFAPFKATEIYMIEREKIDLPSPHGLFTRKTKAWKVTCVN